MKKLLFISLSLLAFLGTQAQKLDNGLLWKISGNGLSKPSYIYGTVHITCDATLDKNILAAFDATNQLYLELDMDDPNMQTEMMAGVMMKNGTTMKSLATPEDYALVNKFLQDNVGMSADLIGSFMPSMVSALLYPKMLDCPVQSYEQALMEVAKKQNEEIYGLETIAEQLNAFGAIPYKEQMDELVKSAKDNLASDKKEMTELLAIYNKKDLNVLLDFMNKSDNKLMSQHSDVMLVNRNKNWIPKIEAVAKQNPTFFGVGAAHLAGDDGVIKLLRKKGYKVEAVK
ncbi:TraB/GumN family protein [Flavobacterium sp. Sd200]|uniref:TraB/GumN family protein n=1 Tax=Flavobacterium sp. Sd200 TaxID=2692211 RepID=UPI00136D900B|nr:TraB/GumN family protein [Flavobacterium sp. Sd200]MXN90323.1 TraB/GumN family protein [Flavobacterium sp. Sd200]